MNPQPIPALLPHGEGHQFVFYGDCCSGVPGKRNERNFAEINAALRRMVPEPEFVVFLGDHIAGYESDPEALRRQWTYWHDKEMCWLDTGRTPVYHVTSNHNTFDEQSERIWCDVFPAIPRNGPAGQEGLSYWVQRRDLLMVFVNTSFTGLGGYGHVECEWLEGVLAEHEHLRHKIVIGHHPVFPVNGYNEQPKWCVIGEEGERF